MINKKSSLKNGVIILVLMIICLAYIVFAPSFSEPTFSGTFNRTYYNDTYSAVMLNSTFNNGTYTSQIFDATNANWTNISWWRAYGYELPRVSLGESDVNVVNPINTTGLVGYYNFNNNTLDYSGNGYNGINNGANCSLLVDGKFNTSCSFNGVSSYINSTYSFNYTQNDSFTFSAWAKTNSISKSEAIFGSVNDGSTANVQLRYAVGDHCLYNSWHLYIRDTSGNYVNNICGNLAVQTNSWYHVVGVRNRATDMFYIYVNGVLMANITDTTISNMNLQKYTFLIGATNNRGVPADFFNGNIDEITIWNRSLSASEIQNLYLRGATRLNLSVRNCTSSCTTESYTNLGIANPVQTLGLTGRYFQYLFDYSTDNSTYNYLSPLLYNTTLNYDLLVSTPNISDIKWSTTGGFTDDTLIYDQTMDYINITVSDTKNLTGGIANLTILKPSGAKAIDNQIMDCSGNDTDLECNFSTDFKFNEVGAWQIIASRNNTDGIWSSRNENFTVSLSQPSIIDGYYGYRYDYIPPDSEISNDANTYEIMEFRDNASYIGTNWTEMKRAVNYTKTLNIKSAIVYMIDWNMSSTSSSGNASRALFISNITSKFPDLLNSPYLESTSWIMLYADSTGYADADITTNTLNIISEEIVDAVDNKIPVVSNYNSSTLDTDYIRYADGMIYLTSADSSGLINQLANLTKSTDYLTRIYYDLSAGTIVVGENYYQDVMRVLTSTINSSSAITDDLVSELDNGDLIVYNNGSSAANYTYNLSAGINVIGKDIWDFNNHILLENNSNGNVTFLDINGYRAHLIGTEDLSYIIMDSNIEGNVITKTPAATLNSNVTNGYTPGEASACSTGRAIELWDKRYNPTDTVFFYGELNQTGIKSPYVFNNLTYLVVSDKNDAEVDKLFWDNITIGKIFGYVSVADYNASNPNWMTNKKAEIDAWKVINADIGIFIDGIDYMAVSPAFVANVTELADYVKIDKDSTLAINVFTYFQELSQLASEDGFALYESCSYTWYLDVNGTAGCQEQYNATHQYCYRKQYWNEYCPGGSTYCYGDYPKSVWYMNHNVPVVCLAFQYKNLTDYVPDFDTNHSLLEYNYIKSKALGFEHFASNTPFFRLAHQEKFIDMGEKLQRHPTVSGNLYSMRHENGIAYYNNLTDAAWFDDGRLFNSGKIRLDLYASAVYNYNICINNYCGYSVTTAGEGWYYPFDVEFNETVFDSANGHYTVSITSADGGYVAEDRKMSTLIDYGKHAYYNNSGPWAIMSDSAGNYVIAVVINDSIKASIDKTDKITQTLNPRTHQNKYQSANISSDYPFNVNIYTYPINNTGVFRQVRINNIAASNITFSSDCDTENAVFSYNSISGQGSVGVCVDNTTSNIFTREDFPSLSNRNWELDTDDVVPSITFTYPTNNQFFNVYANYLNFTTDESATCVLNDTLFDFNWTDNVTHSYMNNSVLPEGTRIVNASCWDIWGNNVSNTDMFTYDYTKPVVTILNDSFTSFTNDIDVYFNVTDNLAQSLTCKIYLNQTLYNTKVVTVPPFDITANDITPDGNYTINITCSDEATNLGYNDSIWVVINTDITSPKIQNLYIYPINSEDIVINWQNEADLKWTYLKISGITTQTQNFTGGETSWVVSGLGSDSEYNLQWITSDLVGNVEPQHNFTFRTGGWHSDLTTWDYRRLITVNSVTSDLNDYVLNITLNQDNFNHTDAITGLVHNSFNELNWTNGNDIRFVDYYDYEILPYNITEIIMPQDGCKFEQLIPDEYGYTGTLLNYINAHDGDWGTYATPNPAAVDYFNYTIPANSNGHAIFSLLDGGGISQSNYNVPAACFGGTKLRFKEDINSVTENVYTYCQNNTDDTWIMVRNNTGLADYVFLYETQVMWEYSCSMNILVKPTHFDNITQANIYGMDGQYTTRLRMYYGNNATANASELTYAGVWGTYSLGVEENYAPVAPIISNLQLIDNTTTSTNFTWSINKLSNNRVKYATNQWLLGYLYSDWDNYTFAANIQITGLDENTTYWYNANATDSVSGLSDSVTGSFVLGTPANVPVLSFINYSEDRLNENVTICINLTNMAGYVNVNISLQYFNTTQENFSNSDITEAAANGVYCFPVDVAYGQTYTYRGKATGNALHYGYSNTFTNEFLRIQEFFAGNFIDDNNQRLTRQYCPPKADGTVNLTAKCYTITGLREGSVQTENYIEVETNVTDQGVLVVHLWDSTNWSLHNMTNNVNLQYVKIGNLGFTWHTLYITNQSNNLIMNLTKPSTDHPLNSTRRDISKYIKFNGTPENITYKLMYFDFEPYNTTYYDWNSSLRYTPYDIGQFFRGGYIDGGVEDTGTLRDAISAKPMGSLRTCVIFDAFWWDSDLIPANNITNYYWSNWVRNYKYSSYYGTYRPRTYRFTCITWGNWTAPADGQSHIGRDLNTWTETHLCYTNSDIATENLYKNVPNATFHIDGYNLSISYGYKEGMNIDTSDDQIYNIAYLNKASNVGQMVGQYHQGYIIFNLPSNASLAGMDSDSDGLTDFYELYTSITNPKWNDTDDDGMTDKIEIDNGYDPLLWNNHSSCYYVNPQGVYVYPGGEAPGSTVINWNIDCSENCNITMTHNLYGNNLSMVGIGNVLITSNIYNYTNWLIQGIDEINRCEVIKR